MEKFKFVFLLLTIIIKINIKILAKEKNTDTKYNDYVSLKKNDHLYIENHSPYVPYTKKINLLKNEIKKKVSYTKEIILDEKNNNKMFKNGYHNFIQYIFDGIKEKKIIPYKNSNLTQKMSIEEVNKKMLIPKNVEFVNVQNKNKYFLYSDIKIIEIDGFYVETINFPRPIFDNLTIKIIIPAEIFDNTTQHIICYLQYEQCMKYLSGKNIKIYKNGKNIDCKKAFDENLLNFMYVLVDNIDINQNFKIKKDNYEENHLCANIMFSSAKQ